MVHSSSLEDPAPQGELCLTGIAVSRGIGVGPIEFLETAEGSPEHLHLDPLAVPNELERLRFASERVRSSLNHLSQVPTNTHNLSDIIDSHILILDAFVEKVEYLVHDELINSEWAIAKITELYANSMPLQTDGKAPDRQVDIKDVAERLTNYLGSRPVHGPTSIGTVVVAHEVRPSVVIELAKRRPAAIVTERGGWTSHSAILARELEIPMVSGLQLKEANLSPGKRILVDGNRGEIIIDPSIQLQSELSDVKDLIGTKSSDAIRNFHRTFSIDGVEVSIRVNLESAASYAVAHDAGANGIGLYRSELLISPDGVIPEESDQLFAYSEIAQTVSDGWVNIRTFDNGYKCLVDGGRSDEVNPALGLRSIRSSLRDQVQFRRQIRAIIGANGSNNVRLVLPFVSGLSEVLDSKRIILDEYENVSTDQTSLPLPKIGAMIEIPSAVFMADRIAEKVDFLCLGTNDLVQYMLAVDRDNDRVADWYESLHPSVIRAITQVIGASKTVGIPLTVCGEMAGSPFYVPLLIGLGVRDLSMNANSIPHVRRLISGISIKEAESLATDANRCLTAPDVENLLRKYYLSNWSSLFPPGLLDSPLR